MTVPGQTAHGVIIKALSTNDVAGVDPVTSLPTIDLTSHEPERNFRDTVFPASLVNLTRARGLGGDPAPVARPDRRPVPAGDAARPDRDRAPRAVGLVRGRVLDEPGLLAAGDQAGRLDLRRLARHDRRRDLGTGAARGGDRQRHDVVAVRRARERPRYEPLDGDRARGEPGRGRRDGAGHGRQRRLQLQQGLQLHLDRGHRRARRS